MVPPERSMYDGRESTACGLVVGNVKTKGWIREN